MPNGQHVAAFLGAGEDPDLIARCEQAVPVVSAFATAYTRGAGFVSGTPAADLDAVITAATARLVANPEQIVTTVGGVTTGAGFSGWSLAESFVLNRYRKRATG